ncbi:PAS fold-4 domain protein [Desulfobulbus propionicus DSM 2032]|jgi:PAS fold.|uniref:PAS fold-4 domain protein n=1 Tax=Desulfobulbus propionicus (strain ATCC 33891 / DSM 2032 / VKM B-1956 / 1pr3) TaxID=577650 RepID=A0A7U3YKG1_DESPD|nr:PAS domain-containing protein [Desulfobulbus propionicus]ADW17023.1 PAS fold-4 domain protein [Desulfobulbus propionicus DSM 2032]
MHTTTFDWVEHYPAAVSVCDTQGTIIAMNRMARDLFAKDGGERLIGTSLFACHPEPANAIIRRLLQEQRANIYFTEKNGVRKLVHQTPWYQAGRFAGLTETIIVLPPQVPTRKRG